MSLERVQVRLVESGEDSNVEERSDGRLVEARLELMRAQTHRLLAEAQLFEDQGSLIRAQASAEEAREDVVKAQAKLDCARIKALTDDSENMKLWVAGQLAESKSQIARSEAQAKKIEQQQGNPRYQGRRADPRRGSGNGERGGAMPQGLPSPAVRAPEKQGSALKDASDPPRS